jgi:hypothetical protein
MLWSIELRLHRCKFSVFRSCGFAITRIPIFTVSLKDRIANSNLIFRELPISRYKKCEKLYLCGSSRKNETANIGSSNTGHPNMSHSRITFRDNPNWNPSSRKIRRV